MYATILVVTTLLAAVDGTSSEDLVPFQEAGKWGFKDAAGKTVVEPKYDKVGAFSSGLAPVNMGAQVEHFFNPPMTTGGKWGYVDARGKLVVPITLDYAHEFSDGLAQVSDDQGVRYLDPNGKVVIDLGRVSQAGDFHEGVAPVYEDRSLAGHGWQTKFIDKKGIKVFVVDGYAEEFHEGMAVLTVAQEKIDPNVSNERHLDGYIDRSGKVAILPRFAEALAFHEGLAAVRPKKTTIYRKGDSWGYIDKSGKYAIEPQFNEAHPFQNGVARVHVGGTLQTPFDAIPYWEGGQWRLIDRTGKVLKRSTECLEYKDAINSKQPQGPATPWSQPTVHGLQTRLVLLAARPTTGAPMPGQVELRHKDGKDWAQNAIVGRYEGAIVVTGGDGKELARHVHALNFNTMIRGGKPLVLCRFDLHDKPYSLDKPGKYGVQFAGFQAGNLATKGMVDLPPTAKLEFEIVPPEVAKPAFPQSKVESRLGLATKALELEKRGQYRAALDLLQQLQDGDFIIPAHPQIMGETEDGRYMAEWVGPHPIGNRRLAMMRCNLQLGNPREAVALAWQTLEAETADASAFACIAQHPNLQGGFDQVESRLRDLLKKNPKHRGGGQCLDYVRVERDLGNGKYPALVERIRSGAWDRRSQYGHEAELKEYVAAALARRSKEALPDLVKALTQNDQPTWIVYCLGRSGDDRAIEPLFNYLLSAKNYYARQETVLALSRFGDKAASYAITQLDSEKPVIRESAAEVLSVCSGDALQKADPGLKHILQALREPHNQGKDGWVNIPTFLLRAVATTRNRDYLSDLYRIKKEAGSFGLWGDRQCIYTLGYLGDTSVVPELIAGLGGTYSHFARPALEAATGKSFPTQKEWQSWWSVETAKEASSARALKAIRIHGGYGHLRSMTLTANGKLDWSGWEPGHRTASGYQRQMSHKEVSEIWQLASQIRMGELQDAYAGGDDAYTVEFVFAERTKTVKVTSSKKDDRPAAFSQLMERLWKTRDQK